MITDWVRFYKCGGSDVGVCRGFSFGLTFTPSVVIAKPHALTCVIFRLWFWNTDLNLRIRYR